MSETRLSNRTTPNLQNHTLILSLFNFIKHFLQNTTLYATHKNITGVCKCLLLRCVCDILNAVLYFARELRHFQFVCAILRFVCKVLKKRGKVLKMCVSSWKKTCYFRFLMYRYGPSEFIPILVFLDMTISCHGCDRAIWWLAEGPYVLWWSIRCWRCLC